MLAPYERCHGDTRFRIVALLEKSERPEMRRSPVEDDEKQVDSNEIESAGYRCPSNKGRKRTGCATDHDILRRGSLEPARVDEHVEVKSCEREGSRRYVHKECEEEGRGGRES